MGDLNAVDIAQQVHEELFGRALESDEFLLRYGAQIPPMDLLAGVYIDDTLVAWICSEKELCRAGPDTRVIDRLHTIYDDENLPRAPEKAFGQAHPDHKLDHPCTQFTTWGTEVHSGTGVVGPPPCKAEFSAFACSGFVSP